MKTKKTKKENWLKRQLGNIQFLPWYWKGVISLVIFFLGGAFGTQLFTAANDASLVCGFIVLVVALWLLIVIWLPKK